MHSEAVGNTTIHQVPVGKLIICDNKNDTRKMCIALFILTRKQRNTTKYKSIELFYLRYNMSYIVYYRGHWFITGPGSCCQIDDLVMLSYVTMVAYAFTL